MADAAQILDRKETRKALRESEVHYRSLFKNSPISIRVEDFSEVKKHLDRLRAGGVADFKAYFREHPDAMRACAAMVRVVDVNRTALRLFGASSKDELLAGLPTVFTEDTFRSFRNLLLAIAGGKTTFRTETPIRTLQGETRHINLRWTAAPGHKKKLDRVYVSQVNITKSKLAQRKLAESEARFRNVIETSPDAIAMLDLDGRILMANRQAALLTGFADADELLAAVANGFELLAAEDHPRACENIAKLMETGLVRNVEYSLRHRDGHRIPVEINTSLERTPGGIPRAMVLVIRDLTERKRLESELAARERQLNSFFLGATAGLALYDRDLRYIKVNDTLAEINGIPAAEHIGKRIRDIVPQIAAATEPLQRKVLVTGEPVLNAELHGETAKQPGVPRHWLASYFPVAGADGRPEAVGAVIVEITARKEAENRLRKLSLAVEQSPASVVITNVAGQIEYVNAKFTKLTGYTSHEVYGKNASILKSGEMPADCYRQLWETITRGEQWRGEFHNKKKNGELYWESASISPVFNELGQITHFVAVKEDITQRKELEYKLSLREQQLNSFFLGATAGLALIDHDLRYVKVNETLAEMNGVSAEEHLGKSVREIVPLLAETAEPLLRKVLATGEPILDFELRGETADRPLVPRHWLVSYFPVAGADGRPKAVGSIVVEITERKQAEESLKLFRALIDQSSNAIYVVDPDTARFLDGNEKACESLGYSREQLLTLTVFDIDPAIDAANYARLAEALQKTKSAKWEGICRRNDGSTFPVEVSLKLVKYDREFYVASVRDMTERKQVEKVLLDAKTAAEAANRAKSEFLANMSHEIRTPMTSILGFSELLQTSELSSEEREEFLDGIHRNGKLLLQLINDILDLSKIEAGKMTVEPIACCPRHIAEDVRVMLAAKAASKGITLELRCGGLVPETIITDPVRLRQILVNLVGNAVKFTERGGVLIELRCEEGDEGLEMRDEGLGMTEAKSATAHRSSFISDPSSRLAFDVSDSGIGIPADKIAALFRPFSQVDASMTRRFGGTGLGLALAKRMASALGGDIRVASEEGRGSTFTLTIPVQLPSEAPCAGSTEQGAGSSVQGACTLPAPNSPLPASRLLLVEDSPEIQRVLQHRFRQMSLKADLADNGEAGCQRAAQSLREGRPYDLILMDVQMPVLNGLDATRRLRQQGWTGPIVALTAHALTEDRDECQAAGCTEYVSKPVSRATLEGIVERYCGVVAS